MHATQLLTTHTHLPTTFLPLSFTFLAEADTSSRADHTHVLGEEAGGDTGGIDPRTPRLEAGGDTGGTETEAAGGFGRSSTGTRHARTHTYTQAEAECGSKPARGPSGGYGGGGVVRAGRAAAEAVAGNSGTLAKFGWSRKNDMFQVCLCVRAVFVVA